MSENNVSLYIKSYFTLANNWFWATWQQSSPYLLSSCMLLVLLCKDHLVHINPKKERHFGWHAKLFNLFIMACNSQWKHMDVKC